MPIYTPLRFRISPSPRNPKKNRSPSSAADGRVRPAPDSVRSTQPPASANAAAPRVPDGRPHRRGRAGPPEPAGSPPPRPTGPLPSAAPRFFSLVAGPPPPALPAPHRRRAPVAAPRPAAASSPRLRPDPAAGVPDPATPTSPASSPSSGELLGLSGATPASSYSVSGELRKPRQIRIWVVSVDFSPPNPSFSCYV